MRSARCCSAHFSFWPRSGRLLAQAQRMTRALVVDDDEPIRTLLAKIVEHEGFAVETAKDGGEAIRRIDADGYNVILLDLMMPRVDGYQVLNHLRDEHPDMIPCTIVATAIPERHLRRQPNHAVF